LKGSSGTLGAQRVRELCGHVEAAARAGELDRAVPLVAELERAVPAAAAALEAELAARLPV
ncbi:MAG: Hpt domain-containing protein, partial [Actinomycetota bacterium]|nr:Hpt domain-containing protein [Actinomycetota bacterium]